MQTKKKKMHAIVAYRLEKANKQDKEYCSGNLILQNLLTVHYEPCCDIDAHQQQNCIITAVLRNEKMTPIFFFF